VSVSTSPSSHRAMRQMRSAWAFVALDQSVLDRSVGVQDARAERRQQRGVKIADLLIAAAAEVAGLVGLHYDDDFERIADITGQATEWIITDGTFP
jgi:predicted nucleic acid-binding protein